TGTVLIPAFLPESLRVPPDPPAGHDAGAEADFSFEAFILRRLEEGSSSLSAHARQHLDRLLLRLALRRTSANQVHAARLPGISGQPLRSKAGKLRLDVTASAEGEEDDKD